MADKQYWLVKTEPEEFSIQDFAKAPRKTTCWDGVRNYQARNMMRDEMQKGDLVLIYHSNADPLAIVGVASVVRAGYPDHTAWDPDDKHFDAKSSPENPRWFMVDLKLQRVFKKPVPRDALQNLAALKDMELLRKGSRLSVQPVRKREFEAVLKLADAGTS